MNNEVVINYIIKKFKLKNLDENKKIFSLNDILKLARDADFIRKSICHFTKKKQKELIETSRFNKVERFVYNTYKNFYLKKQYELKQNNEFRKKMTLNIIISYLKVYFKIYKINKKTIEMVNKMRHKAYYDVFSKKIGG